MTAIECKLIREGGSIVPLGTTEYHFTPQADGAHVAQVADEDHVDIFLSIREGYRLYRGKVEAAPVEAPAVAEPAAPAAIEPAPEVVTMLGSTEDTLPPAEPSPADERAYLAAEYEELYGKAPHHKTSNTKLRELIAAKQTV